MCPWPRGNQRVKGTARTVQDVPDKRQSGVSNDAANDEAHEDDSRDNCCATARWRSRLGKDSLPRPCRTREAEGKCKQAHVEQRHPCVCYDNAEGLQSVFGNRSLQLVKR